MNICFMHGKIVSEIKFDFFYNSKKHISVAKFKILLYPKVSNYDECVEILVKGYDEVADIIYKEYNEGEEIRFIGYVQKKCVVITNIENKFWDYFIIIVESYN